MRTQNKTAGKTATESLGVTESEFEAYVEVQMSGVTNMWDTRKVSELSGLDKETILLIMKNYAELNELFKGDN